MSTYRVGNHQPQNVYRGEQYIGVMFTAEDAALAVEALNGRATLKLMTPADLTPEQAAEFARQYLAAFPVADSCTCAPPYRSSTAPDPACPVHQGRRARGPKPPPLGPGCICDGSGRTCPRHGTVL